MRTFPDTHGRCVECVQVAVGRYGRGRWATFGRRASVVERAPLSGRRSSLSGFDPDRAVDAGGRPVGVGRWRRGRVRRARARTRHRARKRGPSVRVRARLTWPFRRRGRLGLPHAHRARCLRRAGTLALVSARARGRGRNATARLVDATVRPEDRHRRPWRVALCDSRPPKFSNDARCVGGRRGQTGAARAFRAQTRALAAASRTPSASFQWPTSLSWVQDGLRVYPKVVSTARGSVLQQVPWCSQRSQGAWSGSGRVAGAERASHGRRGPG